MSVTIESTLSGQLPKKEGWEITESSENSCRWERTTDVDNGRVSVVLIFEDTWSVSSRKITGKVGKEKITIRTDLDLETALEEVRELFNEGQE